MKFVIFVFALCACSQDFFEVRGTQDKYRYVDWAHTFSNKVTSDLYYIGTPGYNEIAACAGYALPTTKGLSIIPFVCGATAKEDSVKAVKFATAFYWEKKSWKADAYYAHLKSFHSHSQNYHVLDAGNLTYSITKKCEVGISTGFFHQDGKWNPQYGPLVRRNDAFGYWGVSLRTGSTNELRVIRTFTLKH